jgi:hypothetical protein
MFYRSTPRFRLAWISAAILALMVLSAGTAAADTTPPASGTFTQNGTSAEVYSSSCTPNGNDTTTCSDLGMSVFAGKMTDSFSGVSHGNQVCASVGTYTFDDVTGEPVGEPVFESGCKVGLPKGSIQIGKNLSSVKLATTTIEVHEYVCDDYTCEPVTSRDIAAGGTWTGVGPTSASKYRSSYDDGTCRYNDSGKGSNRQATFAGTIDGQSPSGDVYASISNGKFSYRSRCIEI